MTNQKTKIFPFAKKKFLCLEEQILTPEQNYKAFVHTDLLINYASAFQQPLLHFWELKNTIILGMKDTRTPFFLDGISFLHSQGMHCIIRNSGGLAVASDEGILNCSLIIPNNQSQKISIDLAYQWMVEWISATFESKQKKILPFEIKHSYCPGDFDLSMNGKKFAGIAQRRIRSGIAVMIYLSISGNQPKRGELIKEFYAVSTMNSEETSDYPTIDPYCMANLEELLGTPLSINEAKKQLKEAFISSFSTTLETKSLDFFEQSSIFKTEYHVQVQRMLERNEKINRKKMGTNYV